MHKIKRFIKKAPSALLASPLLQQFTPLCGNKKMLQQKVTELMKHPQE